MIINETIGMDVGVRMITGGVGRGYIVLNNDKLNRLGKEEGRYLTQSCLTVLSHSCRLILTI